MLSLRELELDVVELLLELLVSELPLVDAVDFDDEEDDDDDERDDSTFRGGGCDCGCLVPELREEVASLLPREFVRVLETSRDWRCCAGWRVTSELRGRRWRVARVLPVFSGAVVVAVRFVRELPRLFVA